MNIDNDTLFWVFGVELGMIDCSIHNMNELCEQVVNNYLSSLSIDGYNITPSFDKTTTFYSLNVPYNENNISLNYALEDLNSVGQVFINDSNVTDLSNISLNEGNNVLKIK